MAVNSGAGLDERWRWYNDLLIAYHEAYGVPLSPPHRGASWTPAELPSIVVRAGFTDVRAVTEEDGVHVCRRAGVVAVQVDAPGAISVGAHASGRVGTFPS